MTRPVTCWWFQVVHYCRNPAAPMPVTFPCFLCAIFKLSLSGTKFVPLSDLWQLWRYTPLAVLKIKDSGHCLRSLVFPPKRANSLGQSAPKSVFRQPGFPWNYLIGSRYHLTVCGRSCGWACDCTCDCHSKISLSCASKSSLTASTFCLMVSNLLSLHVQLPTDKSSLFPLPITVTLCRPKGKQQIVPLAMLRSTAQYSASFAGFSS